MKRQLIDTKKVRHKVAEHNARNRAELIQKMKNQYPNSPLFVQTFMDYVR